MEGGILVFGPDMIFRIPALLIALTVHEYAHARVAVALGDSTPKFQGRLTLNPLPHLDPIGLIMLWVAQIGWAKPVEVNARNFTNWRQGMMQVALAGPGANLLTAFISMLLMALLVKAGFIEEWALTLLRMIYTYNIIFAIFNMIPIPPLDGSKVLMNYLPAKWAYQYENVNPAFTMILLIGLVYMGAIGYIIYPIQSGINYLMSQVLMFIF